MIVIQPSKMKNALVVVVAIIRAVLCDESAVEIWKNIINTLVALGIIVYLIPDVKAMLRGDDTVIRAGKNFFTYY